jgi:MFS family permease
MSTDSLPAPPPRIVIYTLTLLIFSHSYLLISPFVYSGAMAVHLLPHLDETNSGYYAGFLSAAFMGGRTISSYAWGKFSDVYGRRTSLIISVGASVLLSLLFGFSPSFSMAVTVRFFLGLVNNIPTIVKTVISEMSHGNKEWEQETMGITFGMWGVGFLIGPSVAGFLSDPVDSWSIEMGPVLSSLLAEFPYLLPNVVGAGLSALSFVAMVRYKRGTPISPAQVRPR